MPVVDQLRAALMASFSRVMDLFRDWDDDESGAIDKREFRNVMPALGLEVDRADADALFDSMDLDGSGLIDYKELNKLLRAGATIELDEALQAGAAGEITLEAKNAFALRGGKMRGGVSSVLGGVSLNDEMGVDADGDGIPDAAQSSVALAATLKEALDKNLARSIDLFRDWDDDGSGNVSRKE